MLATRAAYCEETTLDNLMEELKCLTSKTSVDEFNRVAEKEVYKGETSILSNTYSYKGRDSNPAYTTNKVHVETIKSETSTLATRTYAYNNHGQLRLITDPVFGNKTYEYDYRGFLVNDNGAAITYVGNGNIKSYGTETYEYDTTIKDRFKEYSQEVYYNSSNPLNPTDTTHNAMEFEGRRLIHLENDNSIYDFEYNEQGLRTKKYDYGSLMASYFYDGDKLITELGRNYRLDFLYDEQGLLFGLILNEENKYFYVRDIFQNILGIVDESGSIVVKYDYNAFGKILSVTDTSGVSIGEINPFRYKGYYYDKESQMYYCKSRYYVPAWGRWLNADNPSFLDFQGFSQTNLFSYCGNDPVNNMDENGEFWFTAMTTIIGALVGVASAAITTLITGEELSWEIIAGGAINGAVTGLILGISKGTAIGIASYTAAAVESTFYEICSYANDKELNVENITNSIVNVAVDTLVNGSINYACNLSASRIPSIKTNSGWFIPKSVGGYLTKTYGQRMIAQTIVAGAEGIVLHSMGNKLKKGVHGFVDEITDYIFYKEKILVV